MQGRPESIALVDVSYLFAKSWHAMGRDAHPGEAAQATLDAICAVRESVAHTILCLDAPPYWRKAEYPEYKGQRERPSDEEIAQKKWLLDRIEKDGYSIARVQGFEADDLCATLAIRYSEFCEDIRIVSADKDCAQCVGYRVRMFVPPVGQRPGEVRGPSEVMTKFGVEPRDIPLYLALCGDKSDNIPGVPKVGGTTAAKWIQEMRLDTIPKLVAEMAKQHELGARTPAVWRNLATCSDKLQLWLKLTTLRTDVPIDHEALLALLVRREVAPLVVDEDIERAAIQEETSEMPGDVTTDVDDVQDAEFDPISRAPEGYTAPPLKPKSALAGEFASLGIDAAAIAEQTAREPSKPTTALAKTTATVTEDLQPLDIDSAYRLAKAFTNGRLYSKFHSPEAIFTIIVKARELGLKVTTALDGFHIIEGKPSASADMIRALAMRHPDCEYFRLVDSSAESATWETKHRRHPELTRYTYTLAEAKQAGLNGGNWSKRPRDMVTKTAGSKLARLVYPEATMGLYCPEEFSSE